MLALGRMLLGLFRKPESTAPDPVEFGAWTWAALNHPDESVEHAKRLGLSRIDIMVNGYSNPAWNLASQAKIKTCVKAFQAAGIKVSLTTWARPTAAWIAGIRDEFAPLAQRLGCDITLDIEEPWIQPLTKASDATIDDWANQLVTACRTASRGELAVSCTVYTQRRVLDPLLRRVDTIIPQSYATLGNTKGLVPGGLESRAVKLFAPLGKRIVLGAAAWNVEGAYGLAGPAAVAASLAAAVRLGVPRVRLWHLENIAVGDAAVIAAWAAARRTIT